MRFFYFLVTELMYIDTILEITVSNYSQYIFVFNFVHLNNARNELYIRVLCTRNNKY